VYPYHVTLHPGKNFKSSLVDGLYVFAVHSIHDLDRAYKLLSHENRYRGVLVALILLLGVIVIALPLITKMQEKVIPALPMVTIMKEDQIMVTAVVVKGCIIIGTIHPHHPIPTMLQKLPIRNYVPVKCQHTWSVSPRG
jgi:hypothetical protein